MAVPRMRLVGGTDDPGPRPRGPRIRWTAVNGLIAVNVAAFLVEVVFRPAVETAGAFTIAGAIWHWQLWRFISYQFLHSTTDLTHLVFNMIALWFFGPIVEARFKAARFLIFYLLCGLGGALVFWLLGRMNILFVSPATRLIGASGAVLGLAAGAAKLTPNEPIRLLFPPVTLRLVTIVWGYFAIALYTILSAGTNAGGEAAHVGGLIVGFVLIRNPGWLRMASGPRLAGRSKFWKPGDPPEKFFKT